MLKLRGAGLNGMQRAIMYTTVLLSHHLLQRGGHEDVHDGQIEGIQQNLILKGRFLCSKRIGIFALLTCSESVVKISKKYTICFFVSVFNLIFFIYRTLPLE
jgi:hypothetical protein